MNPAHASRCCKRGLTPHDATVRFGREGAALGLIRKPEDLPDYRVSVTKLPLEAARFVRNCD